MRFKLTDELDTNIRILRDIRDDESAAPAVRIQAIQALAKMMSISNEVSPETATTEADIMTKIRSSISKEKSSTKKPAVKKAATKKTTTKTRSTKK